MPIYHNSQVLQKQILDSIQTLLHEFRKDRSLGKSHPHLRNYLLGVRKEIKSFSFSSLPKYTQRELRQKIPELNKKLKVMAKTMYHGYALYYCAKKSDNVFPYSYHMNSSDYYRECLRLCKKYKKLIDGIKQEHNWTLQEFENLLDKYEGLIDQRDIPDELRLKQKKLLVYRDIIKNIEILLLFNDVEKGLEDLRRGNTFTSEELRKEIES